MRLFANPTNLGDTASHAAAVGIDAKKLDACVAAGTHEGEIRADMDQAEAAGVGGTPSFLLAVPDASTGKLKAVKMLTGAQPFAAFKAELDAMLAK